MIRATIIGYQANNNQVRLLGQAEYLNFSNDTILLSLDQIHSIINNRFNQEKEKDIAEDIIHRGAHFILVSDCSYYPVLKVGVLAWTIISSHNCKH